MKTFKSIIENEAQQPYYKALHEFVEEEYASKTIFPPHNHILHAFNFCDYENIYKEAHSDVGIDIPNHGDLTSWAKQGVLLLNTVLTVQEGCANSHKGKGWEIFTDHIIEEMNKREKPLVFILWGRQAANKASMIDTTKHCVITSAHPSPLSAHRGFFGSRPFSRTNEFLVSQGIEPIDWRID